MYNQLFLRTILRPSIANLFRTPDRILCHCISARSSAILRSKNLTRAIGRSYAVTPTTKRRSGAKAPITWGVLTAFLLVGGSCFVYVRHLKAEKEKEKEKERQRSIGKAAIGGPFDLVDTDGKEVTNASFFGKWVLIYFGFCHCPDICPDQLEKMTEIINQVDAMPRIPNLQPIYITVDPNRDTKELIKEYIKDFHPNMIGLTGTEEQVKRVCKAFRVYFSAGPRDDDDDYIVDHTVIMYLLNDNGEFMDYFGQNKTISEIVGTISTKMVMKVKKSS